MQSYYCRIFQQRFLFLNSFSIDLVLFNITRGVLQLRSQFRKLCQSKQQPLRGGRYLKFWGREGNLTWRDLALYGGT